MKHILFLVDKLTLGGAQVVLFNLVTHLDHNKYRPFVLTLFQDGIIGDRLREKGFFSKCLEMQLPFRLKTISNFLPQLTDFSKKHEIDLIHSLLTASGFYGAIVAKKIRKKSILNVHGPLSKGKVKFLEILTRNLNDILIAGNRLTEEEIKTTLFWGRGIHQIYNGIEPSGKAEIELFSGRKINLTMVANFFPEKDHLTLIKAFEILQKKYPLILRIIADGENRFKKRIYDYISEREIKDIEFRKTREADLLSAKTDIFVLTSHSEGLPLSVTEAMSAGLPVVASDVGAMNEVIEHRKDGILVPPESVEDVVKALSELIEDEELRRNLSMNAIKKFNGKFTIERMIKNYHNLYESLDSDAI